MPKSFFTRCYIPVSLMSALGTVAVLFYLICVILRCVLTDEYKSKDTALKTVEKTAEYESVQTTDKE